MANHDPKETQHDDHGHAHDDHGDHGHGHGHGDEAGEIIPENSPQEFMLMVLAVFALAGFLTFCYLMQDGFTLAEMHERVEHMSPHHGTTGNEHGHGAATTPAEGQHEHTEGEAKPSSEAGEH